MTFNNQRLGNNNNDTNSTAISITPYPHMQDFVLYLQDIEKLSQEIEKLKKFKRYLNKSVFNLNCKNCLLKISERGMKSYLLFDSSMKFSASIDQVYNVSTINEYENINCDCLIGDLGCTGCGTVVGYEIRQPCLNCVMSNHNGHCICFDGECIISSEIENLNWGKIYFSPDNFHSNERLGR
ncbi:Protein fam72a [Clydaea vesicula]|uniref:Protein fam72a n=1 Tax=Clydaea vesicula TaxID=447962 RepID=A0AAD5XVY6_9FUNG|nr:Protein fam72a [Clydaea vesicula]